MTITIDANKNKGVLMCADSNTFEYIRHHFSIENKAKRFVKNPVIARKLPSRLYAITPTGLFDAGLAKEICSFVAAEQLASKVVTTPMFDSLCAKGIKAQVFQDLSLQLRDYQHQAVEKCLQNGRGLCILGTGAGKTLITAALACSILHNNANSKILMLVPDPGLADQTYKDFQSYSVPFSMCLWTGTTPTLNAEAQIIIANQDILLSRLSQNEWLKTVDAVIVDEVHTIKKDNKITKALDSIKTQHKFGFTGTLPTDQLDLWCILGKIGHVLMTKTSAELREQQVLVNAKVNVINVTYKDSPKYESLQDQDAATKNYRTELEFVYHNAYRNNIIKQICSNYSNNILILINHLQHGDALYELLKQTNKHVEYIKGETSLQDRDAVKQLLESSDGIVCIAMSSIFSTGINIKNLHMIIFAAGGKSFIRVVQSIGRGLRKALNKHLLTIIDIVDNLRYGVRHSQQRFKTYEIEKINCFHTHLVEK